MAAKKTEEAKVTKEEVVIEEAATTEETKAEDTAETTEVKKEGFIKKGVKKYKEDFKAHPIKTIIKTAAVPAAFVGGVLTGKAIFGEKADAIVDVAVDVIEDVVDNTDVTEV